MTKPVSYQHLLQAGAVLGAAGQRSGPAHPGAGDRLQPGRGQRGTAAARVRGLFRLRRPARGRLPPAVHRGPRPRRRLPAAGDRVRRWVAARVARIIAAEAGLDPPRARALAAAIVGMAEGAAGWWLDERRPLERASSTSWPRLLGRGSPGFPAAPREPDVPTSIHPASPDSSCNRRSDFPQPPMEVSRFMCDDRFHRAVCRDPVRRQGRWPWNVGLSCCRGSRAGGDHRSPALERRPHRPFPLGRRAVGLVHVHGGFRRPRQPAPGLGG